MKSSRMDYINAITGCTDAEASNTLSEEQRDRMKAALEKALEIRKFEIELYWKRAQYFWGFLITIYGSYFLVYSKVGQDSDFQKDVMLLVLSTLGVFFSLGWHLVNRGSKFWQENWENHVNELEDYIYGPLFKTVIARTDYGKKLFLDYYFAPVTPYPFSVSKINCLLSNVFFLSSMGLMLFESNKWVNKSWQLWAIGVLIIFMMFIHYSQGDIAKEIHRYKEENEQPVFILKKKD